MLTPENPVREPDVTLVRRRGRPKGSKNRPKVEQQVAPPAPVVEAPVNHPPVVIEAGEVLPPGMSVAFTNEFFEKMRVPGAPVQVPETVLIKDGVPNLPVAKLIGRPTGSKNSVPRKKREPKVMQEAEGDILLLGHSES